MSIVIPTPDLVVPAGDLEKLQTAVRFGASAVYVGAGTYSLRPSVGSLTLAELEQGIRFAHERGCKVYLALNIFAYDSDLAPMLEYFREAEKLGIDAVIVSDPGVVELIRQSSSNVKIHLSTQANTLNSAAVKFWMNQGVSRLVVGRELSLNQIKEIKDKVPQAELEMFMHGAMCVAYSGRCLLSRHLTDRSANRGECAQPCRWEYHLQEKQQGDEMIIEEDSRGTYILNSRDLCMINHIPDMVSAGVSACKIEGRMKSAYYVAVVTRTYRQALDAYCGDSDVYRVLPEWQAELDTISHRPYTTGFYFGGTDREYTESSEYYRGYDYIGMVTGYDPQLNTLSIEGRNQFRTGETVEIIDPHVLGAKRFVIREMRKTNGEIINSAHNNYKVMVGTDTMLESVSAHSLLRRKR
jgi:putative protease